MIKTYVAGALVPRLKAGGHLKRELEPLDDARRPASRARRIQEILREVPSPAPEEIRVARERLAPYLDKVEARARREVSPGGIARSTFWPFTIMVLLITLLLVMTGIVPQRFLWSCPGPLTFVVVTSNGRPASPWRMVWRNMVIFSPFIPTLLPVIFPSLRGVLPAATPYVAMGLFLVGVAWSVASPSRGLQDRIAGTWVVPR
jgi:hypothetical protein